jgi:hypothetical protein
LCRFLEAMFEIETSSVMAALREGWPNLLVTEVKVYDDKVDDGFGRAVDAPQCGQAPSDGDNNPR